jgi:hypothetical protein
MSCRKKENELDTACRKKSDNPACQICGATEKIIKIVHIILVSCGATCEGRGGGGGGGWVNMCDILSVIVLFNGMWLSAENVKNLLIKSFI